MYIYIAGSSRQIERAKAAARALAKEFPGGEVTITHRWWDIVEKVGEANPVDAQFHERMCWAADDLKGVEDADVVWLLMPPKELPCIGAYWEAGYADALGIDLVISGPDLERTIFTARGCCYDTDAAALDYITDLCNNEMDCAGV